MESDLCWFIVGGPVVIISIVTSGFVGVQIQCVVLFVDECLIRFKLLVDLLVHAFELRKAVCLGLLELVTRFYVQCSLDPLVQASVFFFQTEDISQNQTFRLFKAPNGGAIINNLLKVKHRQIGLIVNLKALLIGYQVQSISQIFIFHFELVIILFYCVMGFRNLYQLFSELHI